MKPTGEKIWRQNIGWHVLRHTYRSLLDETGAPVGIQQKLMRHSNVATTTNICGNVSLEAKQQANLRVVEMVTVQDASQLEQ